MSENLIQNTIHTNYMYTALTTALTKDKSILRNGITNETPIVKSCGHSSWDDFRRDGMRYIFFINFKMNDFLVGTIDRLKKGEIINQCFF